jgi:hypothetical protein
MTPGTNLRLLSDFYLFFERLIFRLFLNISLQSFEPIIEFMFFMFIKLLSTWLSSLGKEILGVDEIDEVCND